MDNFYGKSENDKRKWKSLKNVIQIDVFMDYNILNIYKKDCYIEKGFLREKKQKL